MDGYYTGGFHQPTRNWLIKRGYALVNELQHARSKGSTKLWELDLVLMAMLDFKEKVYDILS